MAKMASLHAEQSEPDWESCELCSEEIMICDMLEECPGKYQRQIDRGTHVQ